MKRLYIPDQWTNLLSDELSSYVRTKESYPKVDGKQRKANYTIPDFLKHMVRELHDEIEYIENIRKHILPALSKNNDSKQVYEAAKIAVYDSERAAFDELIILLRQKKLLADDLTEDLLFTRVEEELPFDEIRMLYTDTMVQRISSPVSNTRELNQNSRSFRYVVELRYESMTEFGNSSRCWCNVLGWFPPKEVEATHIVPKALDSPELSYLFGAAGENALSDPRNGLMLHKSIKTALHSGQVVLLPLPLSGKGPSEWKLVVTNPKLLESNIWTETTGFVPWSNLNGKRLQFRNHKRPARRYLFFRFVLTYLWSNDNEQRRQAWKRGLEQDGQAWPLPGNYARRSMLLSLCNMAAHVTYPDAYHDNCTFDDEDKVAVKVSADAEEAYLCELVLKLRKMKQSLVDAQPNDTFINGHANGY